MTLAPVLGHMYCNIFTSPLLVLVFAALFVFFLRPVLFEHLGLKLFLFEYAGCSSILSMI